MWFLLILLIAPMAHASCLDNNDPTYILAVNEGHYDLAFHLVARELHLTSEEEKHFQVIPGFSRAHDDRHGQADPDTLELKLDPGLFIEGKEGACQGMAHELAHLKQFERDRKALHVFYADKPNAAQAENAAYDQLEDNDLATHAASEDIEAVLAQVPYAQGKILRDEDLDYLRDQLKTWVDHVFTIQDQSNNSYYLPEIKKIDTRLFCRGVQYIQRMRLDSSPYYSVWQMYCRIIPKD
jgi:hypothetical protein